MKIGLIILAAGKSERFPGNKLLAEINGEPMISRVVKRGLNSKADIVVVVTGHEAGRIREVLRDIRDPKLRVIYNPGYPEGQSSSVKAGVRELIDEVDAVLILPGDVAFIETGDIDKVIEKFLETRAPIVVASHRGRHGHPILFSKKLFNEILKISEESFGLKAVVSAHRGEVAEAEASRYTIIDIDTREDLDRMLD